MNLLVQDVTPSCIGETKNILKRKIEGGFESLIAWLLVHGKSGYTGT